MKEAVGMRNGSTERQVVVTGAASGIGRATALALARGGFGVYAGVRKAADAEALEKLGEGRIKGLVIDVTDRASIAAATQRLEAELGGRGLHGLVNNAGIGSSCPLEFQPLDEFRKVYDVNVFGLVAVTQAMLGLIRQGQGRIVNIGSVGDRFTVPFGAALCSSKAAVRSVTEALRMELHPFGIHVCLIQPTSIATPAVTRFKDEAEARLASLPEEALALYGRQYRTFVKRAVEEERRGSAPDVVAHAVYEALTERVPATRRLAGKGRAVFAFLTHFVPDRPLDFLRFVLLGLPLGFGAMAAHRAAKKAREVHA
jgi:NAD(P)-dependent dehydrogenase (short-subunit alcohol dehydrogenase family)